MIEKLLTRQKSYAMHHERALTANILGEIGDRRAVDALISALEDPSKKVRKSAERALELLSD